MNSEVRVWLESPDGEEWSRNTHRSIVSLISVKGDVSDMEIDYLWTT